VGLLINFNELKLVEGVHRLILPGADTIAFCGCGYAALFPSV
jgi:hypothetical protein